MHPKGRNTCRRYCQLSRHHGKYILLLMFCILLMGMELSAEQQEGIRDLTVAKMGKEDMAVSSIQEDTSGKQNQTKVSASIDLDSEQQLVFELEPSSPSEKWEAVYHAIARCAKLDLTVWYPFGSIRLKMQPEGNQCRMNLFFEGELTESNRQEVFTCLGDPAVFRELDLVHDGRVLRDGPPTELPEALIPFCNSISPNP